MTHPPVIGPLVIGHRGARGLFPENTLEGFAATAALGVNAIELDVALTADNVPVVSHDPVLTPALTRGPDGRWLEPLGPRIRDLSVVALAGFDVGRLRPGSTLAVAFPDQLPADGARIPRLEAALARPDMRFLVELKTMPDRPELTASPERLAAAALAAAERAGALGRTRFESFDWRGPRALRRLRPELPLAWLTRPETAAASALWWDGRRLADHAGSVPRAVAAEAGPGGVWAPEHCDLTEARIAEAHALGLRVYAWTVNAPADIARLAAAGADAIVTDYPDRARAVLRGS